MTTNRQPHTLAPLVQVRTRPSAESEATIPADWPQFGSDIEGVQDVQEFVRRFYALIGPWHAVHPYLERSRVDLTMHEEKMTDFWLGVLGDEPAEDPDVVIEAHRASHAEAPFDPELFDSWLDTFDLALDSGWSGPRVERIRKRGYGFARAMALRFTGMSLRHPPGYIPPEAPRDLTTRSDIDALVEQFYRDVSMDDLLHDHFETVVRVNWQAHMLSLGDYWEGVLFTGDHEVGEHTIETHRHLHERLPFTKDAFLRWLDLFDSALDQQWVGPNTEQLRRHSHGMARAMARRFLDVSLPRSTAGSRPLLPLASTNSPIPNER